VTWAVLRALPILVAASCGHGGGTAQESREIVVKRLVRQAASGFERPEQRIVRDPAEWQRTWAQLRSPEATAPDVDFQREMVVVVAAGRRNSGGFDIAVQAVHARAHHLEVVVRTTEPGEGCVVTGLLTSPVDVVVLPRSSLPVRFRLLTRVEPCR
jgi:hypothetical protein